MRLHYPRLAFAGLMVGATLSWAAVADAAMDPKQTAEALVASIGADGGSKATYDKATASGANVTITNVKITGRGDTIVIPTVVVTNPNPRTPGGFTADRMTFDAVNLSGSDTKMTWKSGAIDSVTVPSPSEIQAKTRVTPFSRMALGGLSISTKDLKQPLAINGVSIELANVSEGTPHDAKLLITGIVLPAALFQQDKDAKATMEKLGYTSGFTVNVAFDGGYDNATDTLTFRDFNFDTKDVGKFSISGVMTGVPLSKLQDTAKAQELLATAKLTAATIRFENSGVMEKLLDMQAKSMGVTRDQFVTQISAAMPLMLNVIGNPPFQDKLTAAATAFLKEPKSVTISATPAQPVPLMQIIGAAMSAPGTLPDVMVVDIKANN